MTSRLLRQLRDALAPGPRADEPSGDGQPTPVPETAPPGLAGRHEPTPEREPATRRRDPAEALPVAQAHELLGPCRGCEGYWTRVVKRGQKPLDCPVCKREGPPEG